MHAFGRWGHPPLGISPGDGTAPQPQKQNLDCFIVHLDCSILHFWLSAIANKNKNISINKNKNISVPIYCEVPN